MSICTTIKCDKCGQTITKGGYLLYNNEVGGFTVEPLDLKEEFAVPTEDGRHLCGAQCLIATISSNQLA